MLATALPTYCDGHSVLPHTWFSSIVDPVLSFGFANSKEQSLPSIFESLNLQTGQLMISSLLSLLHDFLCTGSHVFFTVWAQSFQLSSSLLFEYPAYENLAFSWTRLFSSAFLFFRFIQVCLLLLPAVFWLPALFFFQQISASFFCLSVFYHRLLFFVIFLRNTASLLF